MGWHGAHQCFEEWKEDQRKRLAKDGHSGDVVPRASVEGVAVDGEIEAKVVKVLSTYLFWYVRERPTKQKDLVDTLGVAGGVWRWASFTVPGQKRYSSLAQFMGITNVAWAYKMLLGLDSTGEGGVAWSNAMQAMVMGTSIRQELSGKAKDPDLYAERCRVQLLKLGGAAMVVTSTKDQKLEEQCTRENRVLSQVLAQVAPERAALFLQDGAPALRRLPLEVDDTKDLVGLVDGLMKAARDSGTHGLKVGNSKALGNSMSYYSSHHGSIDPSVQVCLWFCLVGAFPPLWGCIVCSPIFLLPRSLFSHAEMFSHGCSPPGCSPIGIRLWSLVPVQENNTVSVRGREMDKLVKQLQKDQALRSHPGRLQLEQFISRMKTVLQFEKFPRVWNDGCFNLLWQGPGCGTSWSIHTDALDWDGEILGGVLCVELGDLSGKKTSAVHLCGGEKLMYGRDMLLFHPSVWHQSGVPKTGSQRTLKAVYFILVSALSVDERKRFWDAMGTHVAGDRASTPGEVVGGAGGGVYFFNEMQAMLKKTTTHLGLKWWDKACEESLKTKMQVHHRYGVNVIDRDHAQNANCGNEKEQYQSEYWQQGSSAAGLFVFCSSWVPPLFERYDELQQMRRAVEHAEQRRMDKKGLLGKRRTTRTGALEKLPSLKDVKKWKTNVWYCPTWHLLMFMDPTAPPCLCLHPLQVCNL